MRYDALKLHCERPEASSVTYNPDLLKIVKMWLSDLIPASAKR